MSRAALRAAGRALGAGAALALLPGRGPAQASGDALLRAMRDELARSTTELRLDTLPKPYFVAYRVEEIEHAEVSASLGSLLSSEEIRLRRLTVELRVGDYAFDNTNFFGMPGGPSGVLRGFGGAVSLPLDDDYREVRRQLWLATDAAYKAAVEDLGRKRAALQGRVASEYVPDFSREERTSLRDEVAVPRPSRAAAESLVRDLSALFRHVPEVHRSVAEWQGGVVRTWYLNSEGTSFVRTWPWVGVHVRASTQAADGRELEDFVAARGAAPADLPGRAELVTGVRELAARLTRLRQAPLAEAYNGPILFEGQAAAELFHQVFAPRLVSSRRPVSDHPMFDRFAEREENPFLDRVGGRVLPRFLSVTDDATTRRAEGRALWGFRVDDDGVPAQATRVVERGILRTLLTARVPVRGHPRSTGNRWGDGAVVTNLLVTADSGMSSEELKARLLGLAAARGMSYAVIVRRVANPTESWRQDPMMQAAVMADPAFGAPALTATLALKVYPDGREEPIRNAEIAGISAMTFREIVAASRSRSVYHAPVRALGGRRFRFGLFFAFEPEYAASYVVPSILFEDASIKRPGGDAPQPPLMGPPWGP